MIKIYLSVFLLLLSSFANAETVKIDKGDCMFGGDIAVGVANAVSINMPKQERIEISKDTLQLLFKGADENSRKYIYHLYKIELKVIELVYSWNIRDPEWAKRKFINSCLNGKYPQIFFK